MTMRSETRTTGFEPVTPKEKSQLLANVPLEPSGFKAQLSGLVMEIHVGSQYVIRRPDDPQDICFVVRNGQVEIRDESGERILCRGDFFGEEALTGTSEQPYRSFTKVVSQEGADLLTVKAVDVARIRRTMWQS